MCQTYMYARRSVATSFVTTRSPGWRPRSKRSHARQDGDQQLVNDVVLADNEMAQFGRDFPVGGDEGLGAGQV